MVQQPLRREVGLRHVQAGHGIVELGREARLVNATGIPDFKDSRTGRSTTKTADTLVSQQESGGFQSPSRFPPTSFRENPGIS